MKAFLLAAGVGSRLRPMTDVTPKCLLTVDGECLLDLWLEALGRAGVEEVLVNLHHLPQQVEAHLARHSGRPCVRTAFEPELLGSAGTLLAHRHWVRGEDAFLVCNADNLTDFDLGTVIDAHRRGEELATLAVFRSDRPRTCGIVSVDDAQTELGARCGPIISSAAPRTKYSLQGLPVEGAFREREVWGSSSRPLLSERGSRNKAH